MVTKGLETEYKRKAISWTMKTLWWENGIVFTLGSAKKYTEV